MLCTGPSFPLQCVCPGVQVGSCHTTSCSSPLPPAHCLHAQEERKRKGRQDWGGGEREWDLKRMADVLSFKKHPANQLLCLSVDPELGQIRKVFFCLFLLPVFLHCMQNFNNGILFPGRQRFLSFIFGYSPRETCYIFTNCLKFKQCKISLFCCWL